MSQFVCVGKKNKRKDLPSTTLAKSGAGFTIIELLVVIAIIGLLVSVVVVQTGSIKKNGEDAVVKITMTEVRNAAEIYYNRNGTYEGVCNKPDVTLSGQGDFGRFKDYINEHNGAGVIGCKDDETSYAVISSLNLGDCWCIDSKGSAKEIELEASNCRAELTSIVCP